MSALAADGPTLVMIDCLGGMERFGRPLIVDERSGRLAAALPASGGAPGTWLRALSLNASATAGAWPGGNGFDAALIRLPKAKDALDLALHAAASKVPPGGIIAVFGANDEGIRSAEARMLVVAEDIATVAARHHARVLAGRRKLMIDGLKERLSDWRRVAQINIAGETRAWVSYPGTFAKGGLDEGTAFLIAHLPTLRAGSRVLDFAAGTGIVAGAVAFSGIDCEIDMIEADALALEAARENVPAARCIAGTALTAAGDERYDLIVSNPPIHDGIAESRHVLERLIADAPGHLKPGGRLMLVVQRRVAVMPLLSGAFETTHTVAENGRFTVAMGEGTSRGRSLPPGRGVSAARDGWPRASKRRPALRSDSGR